MTTLIAWWLEGRSDLVKMLYNQRRVWPMTDTVLHKAHTVWVVCVCLIALLFSYGLSRITYNDDPGKRTGILWGVLLSVFVICYLIWEAGLLYRACCGAHDTSHTAAKEKAAEPHGLYHGLCSRKNRKRVLILFSVLLLLLGCFAYTEISATAIAAIVALADHI